MWKGEHPAIKIKNVGHKCKKLNIKRVRRAGKLTVSAQVVRVSVFALNDNR